MNIILYTKLFDSYGDKLIDALHNSLNNMKMKVVHSLSDIQKNLLDFTKSPSIAILNAVSQRALEDILLIRDQLKDVNIILILPDDQKETIEKGKLLQPRFITAIDSDFSRLSTVLHTMEKYNRSEIWN